MAKRFTDTDKWKRPWFNDLPLKAKFFWLYLLDACDGRGVWFADYRLASFQVGFKVTEKDVVSWFGDKILRLDADKFFIRSFVDFQYGELSDKNNAHKPVIKLLSEIENGVTLAPSEDLGSPSEGAHRRPQDKDKDKDKDKSFEESARETFDRDFALAYSNYPRKVGKSEGRKRLLERNLSPKDFSDFIRACSKYASDCRRLKTDEKYIKHFDSFIGTADKEPWRDFADDPKPTPSPVAIDVTSGGLIEIKDVRPDDAEERARKVAELRGRMASVGNLGTPNKGAS